MGRAEVGDDDLVLLGDGGRHDLTVDGAQVALGQRALVGAADAFEDVLFAGGHVDGSRR